MQRDWNEPELKRHLGPVQAPEELWDRVQSTRVVTHVVKLRPNRGMAWRWAAAALAVVAVVAGVALWANRSITSEERAIRALSRTPEQLQFRSDDLAEIRHWVKAGSDLDIPLRGQPAPAVHLIGASLTRQGTHNGAQAVEISYRVGEMDATLVISKATGDGDGRHAFVKSGSYHGANFQSWTMRGEMFTIAAADARVGCLLCHSTGAPRTVSN
jgi:hypothetical protein